MFVKACVELYDVIVEFEVYHNSNDEQEISIQNVEYPHPALTYEDYGFTNEDAWFKELEDCLFDQWKRESRYV